MTVTKHTSQNKVPPGSGNALKEKVWYPPSFPVEGRLPKKVEQLGQSCQRQESLETTYRDELCIAANKRVEPPCCKTLHISLFFDGTNNNINNDLIVASSKKKPTHPTNIARMFRATIGSGKSSGVPPEFNDDPALSGNRFFKYYIPGVGTPFPEVSDLDYSTQGMAFANAGEDRVNWALLRLVDTLQFALTGQWLSDGQSAKAVKAMGTRWSPVDMTGTHNRYSTLHGLLQKLAPAAFKAVQQPSPTQPKLLGIKLYIYGFSRGAAEARTFVN